MHMFVLRIPVTSSSLDDLKAYLTEIVPEVKSSHRVEALWRVQPTKTITSGSGSDRLKHIAENYACTYPEGVKLGPQYVPNGMLIAAAVHMGFKYKTYVDDLSYANVNFNMSKRSIDELDF